MCEIESQTSGEIKQNKKKHKKTHKKTQQLQRQYLSISLFENNLRLSSIEFHNHDIFIWLFNILYLCNLFIGNQ